MCEILAYMHTHMYIYKVCKAMVSIVGFDSIQTHFVRSLHINLRVKHIYITVIHTSGLIYFKD